MSDPKKAPSAFSIRDFRLLTQARFLFAFGVQIQAVVMGWQVYAITEDPLYLGLIGLVEAIPAISLALVSGYIVDRNDPLKIYKGVLAVSFLSALILFLISTDVFAQALGIGPDERQKKLACIYAAALITGVARGFSGPSLYSLIPQIVPRASLNVSSAWISSSFQIASVSGPALGGILYAWKGPSIPYGIDCAMLLAGLLSLAMVRFKPVVRRALDPSPFFERLTSGMRYVFSHQLLLSALALDMFAVLFGGATALLPIFAGEILNTGPWGLGLLRSSPAVGALMMSAVLIRYPVNLWRWSSGKILLGSVAGFGVSIIGFGLSTSFWLSAALLVTSGALDSISVVIRTAIVQLCSPEDMRGRIAAVNSIFIGSSNELGAFESGVAAKLLGTVPAVVFGGCMTLLTVGITARAAPRLRSMELSKL